MIGTLTRQRAQLKRRVTVTPTRDLVVEDLTGQPIFWTGLEPPRAQRSGEDSPRAAPAYTLRWHAGPLGPSGVLPGAGSRIVVEGDPYELLFAPRRLLNGLRTVGWEASAQLVDVLYPFLGELRQQDGSAIQPITFDLWAPDESHANTGVYEDFTAHAPVDFDGVLQRNQRIVLGLKTYNVLNVNEHTIQPHVTFSVRRAGG